MREKDRKMPDNFEIHNFSQLIAQHEDGALNADLSNKLRDIIASLNQQFIDHGGKPTASLTVKLGFKLDSHCVEVTVNATESLPKEARGKTIYWSTSGNMLTRSNPRQQELPFRDVSTTKPQFA